jgi:hypothetical protein
MLRKINGKFQENVSRPGIIDARARYLAAARLLRNTVLSHARTRVTADSAHWYVHVAELVETIVVLLVPCIFL